MTYAEKAERDKWICRAYLNGLRAEEIGEIMSLSESRVYRIINKYGVNGKGGIKGKSIRVSGRNLEMYYKRKEGMTYPELAREYEMSKQAAHQIVHRVARKYGDESI